MTEQQHEANANVTAEHEPEGAPAATPDELPEAELDAVSGGRTPIWDELDMPS